MNEMNALVNKYPYKQKYSFRLIVFEVTVIKYQTSSS